MATWNAWLAAPSSISGRWHVVQRKLGRGLDFLISGGGETANEEVLQLELGSLQPNPHQPRREFGEAELAELAASIREHGVLQPVIVRRHGELYQLVAGERRWRACQQLGVAAIPAIVREADDGQMLELALVENIHRAGLNPMELARAYSAFMERLQLTQEHASERLGKSRSALANTLRLLDLPPDLQDMVSRASLTEGHARALLAIGDAGLQRALAQKIVEEGWTVRDIERAVQAPPPPPPTATAPTTPEPVDDAGRAAHLRDLEAQLRERLGTRVRLQDRGGRGRIVLEYYSREDCDRLLEILLAGHAVA